VSPDAARPTLRVGLTGGIASGKSTVSRMLASLGAEIVDADAIAHRAIDPGTPAHAAIVARFGRGVVADDGTIDRRKLGALVFADEAERHALDAIVHPAVRAEAQRRFEDAAARGCPVAVLDAALLVESGFHRELDFLVVVRCAPGTQLARLVERGLGEDEARARIAAQAPLEAKLAHADAVIDTDGTLDDTRRQVEALWEKLAG
jgi:dephospho-CoA kinase